MPSMQTSIVQKSAYTCHSRPAVSSFPSHGYPFLNPPLNCISFSCVMHGLRCALVHMTFFSLKVLPLDLKSFAPSKIARVLPPSETLPDSPNWNHFFSFYYIDPDSHYSASPLPGLSLRYLCTPPSPNCSAHWGCSINIWRLIPLKYLRCVLHALHLSETTRLLPSKRMMPHSLGDWQAA